MLFYQMGRARVTDIKGKSQNNCLGCWNNVAGNIGKLNWHLTSVK
jgi:hypothetical protein